MKRIFGSMLFSIITASYAGGEAPAWTYRPSFPVKITVLQNGVVDQQSSGAGQENCKPFKLNAAIVKAYFQKAHAIDSTHDYQWSGCKSEGTISFANGDVGSWQINSSRLGFLTLNDGRSFSFFCHDRDCRQSVFEAWRGINADSELK